MAAQSRGAGGTGERVERFRAGLEAFGDALERGDAERAAGLFVLDASWRPGPFDPVLRGRAAIRAHLEQLVAARPAMVTRGRALGMGATYGVAHWVAAWEGTDSGTGERGPMTSDGVVLVAFDPLGRCTSLREWSVTGTGAPGV
jgi:hypothetical protein